MTREVYMKNLFALYSLVEALSRKNGGQVLHLRSKQQEKDLVLRSYPHPVAAYEALVDVRCENLPEVYDVITLEDGQIVLEEYISGITVAQIMETGRLHRRGVKKIRAGLCSALAVLHGKGLVHRDVKPENVMVREDGRVVLIDFNASRVAGPAERDTVIMGTVGYVSPEQLGLSATDSRTDLYAAGVLYNVMLTGKHPSLVLARGRAGRVVKKCTAVNPEDRYPSSERLLQAL